MSGSGRVIKIQLKILTLRLTLRKPSFSTSPWLKRTDFLPLPAPPNHCCCCCLRQQLPAHAQQRGGVPDSGDALRMTAGRFKGTVGVGFNWKAVIIRTTL